MVLVAPTHMRLVALLTDYGLTDYYVGVVKAVIKGIAPDAEFLDISHEVPPFNIMEGAFLLLQASKHLPAGCTVMAVVDPGVNAKRLSIAVRTRRRVYIGPDNGLLYPAASREGITAIYDVGKGPQVLATRGTFAGRDIFAPTAACLVLGKQLSRLGTRVQGMKVLNLPRARYADRVAVGTVLHVDRFGNVVTNFEGEDFIHWRRRAVAFSLRVGDKEIPVRLADSYQEISGTGLIVGSSGAVEVSGRERGPDLKLDAGTELIIKRR